MKQMPAQRERRKKDYERVITLFSSDSFAKDKRTKVSTAVCSLRTRVLLASIGGRWGIVGKKSIAVSQALGAVGVCIMSSCHEAMLVFERVSSSSLGKPYSK